MQLKSSMSGTNPMHVSYTWDLPKYLKGRPQSNSQLCKQSHFLANKILLAKLFAHRDKKLRPKIIWYKIWCSKMRLFNTHFNQPLQNFHIQKLSPKHILKQFSQQQFQQWQNLKERLVPSAVKPSSFFHALWKHLKVYWISWHWCWKLIFMAPSAGMVWP